MNKSVTTKRKCFNLVELLFVMLAIAILIVVSFFGGQKYFNQAKITQVQNDFHNIEISITQMLYEHPSLITEKSTDTGFAAERLAQINRYLPEKLQASGAAVPFALSTQDPWAKDYRVYFYTDNTNAEFFTIAIVSNGPNAKAHTDDGTLEADDLVLVVRLKDAQVRSEYYGFVADNTDGTLVSALIP